MVSYQIAQAKSQFSNVVKAVENGETVMITRGAKKEEVAVVVPIAEWRTTKKRTLKETIGCLEGKMTVRFADDWYMTDEELLNS